MPLKVAALEHELRDDAVEAAALVPVPLLVCAQPYKVGRRHWHNIVPDLRARRVGLLTECSASGAHTATPALTLHVERMRAT